MISSALIVSIDTRRSLSTKFFIWPINSGVLTSYSSHTSHYPSETPCLPWISYATQKLMLDSCKMNRKAVWSLPYVSVAFFPSLKQNFIAYCSLLHSLEWATASIGLHVNAHKTEYMCYNQTGDIITLDGASLKLVDKFTYLGSSVSSTEKDIDTQLTKAWTDIDRLSILWKSDLTNKMKCNFFQAAVISILLYGCTTWTLTKRLKKKLDGNYTRMLGAILNKSWRQHPTRHQLYGHLPPIMKTIQVRRTRHAGHCWRSKDELISDVLLWTPAYGQAKAGRPARTYIQQLCEDTGCNPEDLPKAMNDREKWRERVRDIRASGTTWWWWWWKWPHVQIVFLKFTSCDNQGLVGCIPIAAVAVDLKLKS